MVCPLFDLSISIEEQAHESQHGGLISEGIHDQTAIYCCEDREKMATAGSLEFMSGFNHCYMPGWFRVVWTCYMTSLSVHFWGPVYSGSILCDWGGMGLL